MNKRGGRVKGSRKGKGREMMMWQEARDAMGLGEISSQGSADVSHSYGRQHWVHCISHLFNTLC